MSLRRPAPAPVAVLEPARKPPTPADLHALVASATELKIGSGLQTRPISTAAWQKEAWRHLDLCGELRFAAHRHGNALSRCRIYVAELDEYGRPGKESEDKDVQALSESIFGGHSAKAEAIRLMGVQMYVVGDTYVVAEDRANQDKDTWYLVTPDHVRPEGDTYEVRRPMEAGGGRYTLKTTDMLMRAWTPHPADTDQADSPTRAVLPILREIERLSMLTMSQIDSRLISAGLLLLPAGIDFPHAEDKPGGVVGLMEMILEAARAQLTGAGTAAGLVPILAEIPAGSGADVQHLRFDTELQAQIKDKLDHAIRRLALGLDIAPEELLGQGDSNHWSAWAVDETSIKLFISPALARICGALTTGYLASALEVMGKDQTKFCLWFDTSPLAARPDQREDAFKLWEKGLISTKKLLEVCNFTEDDTPDEQELVLWRLWELAKLSPPLMYDPEFQKLMKLPALAQQAPPAPPALPGQEELEVGPDGEPLPDQEKRQLAADEDGKPTQGKAKEFGNLLPVAELLVFGALERAGGRLLDRHARGRYGAVEKFDLHTHVAVPTRDRAEELLAGAFAHTARMAGHLGVEPRHFSKLLEGYCAELLVRGHPHSTDLLRAVLERWNGGR